MEKIVILPHGRSGEEIPEEDKGIQFQFECPGCGHYHGVRIRPYKGEIDLLNEQRKKAGLPLISEIACWTWDGNLERPTFAPSLLSRIERKGHPLSICHSYVRGGKIEFLSDSTHAFAGKTLDLPKGKVHGS